MVIFSKKMDARPLTEFLIGIPQGFNNSDSRFQMINSEANGFELSENQMQESLGVLDLDRINTVEDSLEAKKPQKLNLYTRQSFYYKLSCEQSTSYTFNSRELLREYAFEPSSTSILSFEPV